MLTELPTVWPVDRRRLVRPTAIGLGALACLTLAWRSGALELRSTSFLVTLVGTALAAVVLLIRRGSALAGRGVTRFARRLALLVGCQVLAVAVVCATVNDWFDFYSSWNDLLGTGQPVTLTLNPPPGPGPAGGQVPGRPGAAVALPRTIDRRYTAPDPRAGRLVPVDIPGHRTGLSTHAVVMLPPQYDEPAYAHRSFPVTLVLAGYPSQIGSLEGSLAVPQTADALLHTGRMSPMVMVLVSPTVVPPRDTECTDIPNGPQVQSFLAEDVPAWVSGHYRVSGAGHWGVLGFSTGGFCAAKLALTYPWVFAAGVSLSGYLHARTDPTTGDLFGGSTAVQQQNDPLWRVQHLPNPSVSLLLTASKQETGVYQQVEQLVAASRPPLAVSTIIRPTGGHNAGVWRGELPLCLQWLSALLPG